MINEKHVLINIERDGFKKPIKRGVNPLRSFFGSVNIGNEYVLLFSKFTLTPKIKYKIKNIFQNQIFLQRNNVVGYTK